MAPRNFDFRTFGSPYDPKVRKAQKTESEPTEAPRPSLADHLREIEHALSDLPGNGGWARGGILTGRYSGLGGAETQVVREPAAYRIAREAVREWIVAAPELAFDDIVGNDDALAQLRDAISAPVLHKHLYEAYSLRMPKGALLYGPPGCGKTMFAKAAVAEMKRLYGSATEFLSVPASTLQSPYVGVTERKITEIFAFAREYKRYHGHPLLVFIDEADAILPDRTGRHRHVAPWEESNVATFLAEMDGMQDCGAFVLLATNRPDALDEAVLRDGRCDFKVEVKRPTRQAVNVILRRTFEQLPIRGAGVADLVFAAAEALYDPALVIHPFGALELSSDGQRVRQLAGKNFSLEHILSGAMVAGLAARASRFAFTRDKAGTALGAKPAGVQVEDVVRAVREVFDENKRLPHAFALKEFLEAYSQEVREESETHKRKGMN